MWGTACIRIPFDACSRQLTLSNFAVRALPCPCAECEPDVNVRTLAGILQQLGINRARLIRAARRRALIDEAAAAWCSPLERAQGIERGCREWNKRRCESAGGSTEIAFSVDKRTRQQQKNFRWRGEISTPTPENADFATKRARIGAFLLEPSSQLSLRALCALIEAKNRKFLISDPGVSLFGILPRPHQATAPP